jgi:hypothetical protein
MFLILFLITSNIGFATELFPGGNQEIVLHVPTVIHKYFLVYQASDEYYNARLTVDDDNIACFYSGTRHSSEPEAFSLVLNADNTVSIKFRSYYLMTDKINKSWFTWREWQYPVFDKINNLGHRCKDFNLVRAHGGGNDAYHIQFIDDNNVTSYLMVDGTGWLDEKAYFASKAYIGSSKPAVFVFDPAIAEKLNKTEGFGKPQKND